MKNLKRHRTLRGRDIPLGFKDIFDLSKTLDGHCQGSYPLTSWATSKEMPDSKETQTFIHGFSLFSKCYFSFSIVKYFKKG